MALKINFFIGFAFCTLSLTTAFGQRQIHRWGDVDRANATNVDSSTKDGYTLVFVNYDSTFDKGTGQRMINTFYTVYPEEAKEYNPATRKKVFIVIDPNYTGVAATAGNVIRINPQWMHHHPEDLDVITHEAMHIVQSYHGNAGPGWITEGIADFVRNEFGVNNQKAGWSLTPFNEKQSYTNAYRITARFLVWIVEKYHKDFVQKLDVAMRRHTYTAAFWQQETGKRLDDLWAEYAANPAI